MRHIRELFLIGLCLISGVGAQEELCTYSDVRGIIRQAEKSKIPAVLLDSARCFKSKEASPSPQETPKNSKDIEAQAPAPVMRAEGLALPQEIELKGNIRAVTMVSSLGKINLRWPRKVEKLFGRTPERAVADAARTVSKALKQSGFPAQVQSLYQDWNIIFMDENLPEKQIPSSLVSNCHPAWMVPPASIYVVAQRVAEGCSSSQQQSNRNNPPALQSRQDADAELAHILLHELGHAVEYQILGSNMGDEQFRAEGFATWFEMYSSDFSSIIPLHSVRENTKKYAQESYQSQGMNFTFSGTAQDYSRVAMLFEVIVKRKSLSTLMRIYSKIREDNLTFLKAVDAVIGWDYTKLTQESIKMLS